MMEGAICMKSELDLFNNVPTQLSIDDSSFVEIHPIAALTREAPIEFYITGNGDQYLDLSHTLLHLRIRILNKNDTDLGADDVVAPINYLLNTLFSECSIYLNDKQIASQTNYAYRAYLESLLFFNKSSQDNLLSSSMFFKDDSSKFNIVVSGLNTGFDKRSGITKLSKEVDLMGPLHFDLASQPKLLINGVNVRVKLEQNKDVFTLMSLTDKFKIKITLASLYVRKVTVAPSIMLAHEKALESGVIKMPIRRIDVKTFALPRGGQSSTIANAFIGQLPTRIILGLVSNSAYNGVANKNPFNFSHYKLSHICAQLGGRMIPSNAYQPNFDDNLYVRCYLAMFTDLNRFHNASNININYADYKEGYCLYVIDLTPDLASNESHVSVNKTGSLTIDIKFKSALDETLTLIAYADYRNCIEIDKSRGVFTDF